MQAFFQFAQELADVLAGVKIALLPNNLQALQKHLMLMLEPEGLQPVAQALLGSFRDVTAGYIYQIESPLGLRFAAYADPERDTVLVIGPCRGELGGEKELSQLRRLKIPQNRIGDVLAFCRRQPVLSSEKLYCLADTLCRQLTGSREPVPYRHLDDGWQTQERGVFSQWEPEEELDAIRRIEGRYEASAALTEAVKQGNLSLAYRFIRRMGEIPQDLTRSPNPLRNAQNLCIVLNTQLRHALEEAGHDPYRLDRLSGAIARQIEKLENVTAANGYFGQIISQYCQLAQEKEQAHLSTFGRMAVTYIKSHLSDNLTVKEAAKALLVNPDYLSAQFHREVGISFINYVNRERIQQAAALLGRTQLQVQQIASAVGYNNTSYFAKQFVRFMGMTPSAYRKGRRAGV